MINFDTLPKENPFGTPDPGVYRVQIVDAEMKQGQDAAKPMYLNMKYSLIDMNGNNKGNLYDMMFDSDNSVTNYKLGRFVRACAIPLQGAMELKDLAKLVKGKEFVIWTVLDKPKEANRSPRLQPDIFGHEGYYMMDEYTEVIGLWKSENGLEDAVEDTPEADFTAAEVDAAFNAPDGVAQADTEY